ncbi:MAG: YfhO family protein, partial [Proteobacteria bacterium]|nr:YfhO family protein [Pseudomonadota bacterium]
ATGGSTEMTLGTEIVDSAHRARLIGSETALITGAKILEYRANRVVIETDSAKDGVLILSDAHAPGWSATVDSNNETILKVNGFIRGVFVESGPHTVLFTYSPPGFRIGVLLFVTGVAIAALLIICPLFCRNRYRRKEETRT